MQRLPQAAPRPLFTFQLLLKLFAFVVAFFAASPEGRAANSKPNIVIIFLDDAGYGDFSPFNPDLDYKTPHVDQLAAEGGVYQNFYVPQAVCSASRSALLTGLYPGRTGVFGAHAPRGRGLEPEYKILPELLKPEGYVSAMVGKWHLGDQDDTRPHSRGFDHSSGLMYSNDMWKHHPGNPEFWGKYPISYWENGDIIDEDIDKEDQKLLTKRYTESAVEFIEQNASQPFFLYLAHSMPHVPLFCSDDFAGKSGAGLYGDVIMEIDWSVGQVNAALKKTGVEENTIVIFTSDNGPWLDYGNHAGQTPFRLGKRSSFDGGTRSACIIKYPPAIAAGSVSQKAFASIDLAPSLLNRVQAKVSAEDFDGMDQWPVITGQANASNPQTYYAFTVDKNLESIMSSDGRWKYHLEHDYRTMRIPGKDGKPGKSKKEVQAPALYNLALDPMETNNLLEVEPWIAAQLQEIAEAHLAAFPKLAR